MKSKLLTNNREKTWALVFAMGDEPMSGLENFAKENKLSAARFTAIGAFERVMLAYFDWEKREYRELPINEQARC